MDIHIREILPTEFEILRELNRLVFLSDKHYIDDLDIAWPDSTAGEKYYRKVVNKTDNRLAFVAEKNNVVVGYVALMHKSSHCRTCKYIEIENMGILPDYQSTGIGTKLLKRAVTYAKANKADRLELSAFSENVKALSFYRNFGFDDFSVSLQLDLK